LVDGLHTTRPRQRTSTIYDTAPEELSPYRCGDVGSLDRPLIGYAWLAVARRLPARWPLPSFPAGAGIGKATGRVSIDRLFVL
jgi:hypothetical protein